MECNKTNPDPQDSLVTSTEDVLQIDTAPTSGLQLSMFQFRNGRKKKLKAMNRNFSWLGNFYKLCHSALGSMNIETLLNLINVYTEHVSREVNFSYTRPNRAAKLKKNFMEILVFFHNCYMDIKAPLDETAYMEKMSDLLTMYMDVEIKSSRRGKESLKKITSKLISALFVILDNSPEYILDTILKARFTIKSYSEICIPIFKRVTNLPVSQDLSYVRFLLIFKLWKRHLPKGEERNCINRLAVAKLSPPPKAVLEMVKRGILVRVLAPLPCNKKPALITRFYMTAKFNVRDSIKALMKVTSQLKLSELTTSLETSKFFFENAEQENLTLSEDSQDENFEDSIWADLSDYSSAEPEPKAPEPKPSEPVTFEVILDDDTDTDESMSENRNQNINNTLNISKAVRKGKALKKIKKKKKNNNNNNEEQETNKSSFRSTSELGAFQNLFISGFDPIRFLNETKENDQLSCKSLPSTSAHNEFMSEILSTSSSLEKSLMSISNNKTTTKNIIGEQNSSKVISNRNVSIANKNQVSKMSVSKDIISLNYTIGEKDISTRTNIPNDHLVNSNQISEISVSNDEPTLNCIIGDSTSSKMISNQNESIVNTNQSSEMSVPNDKKTLDCIAENTPSIVTSNEPNSNQIPANESGLICVFSESGSEPKSNLETKTSGSFVNCKDEVGSSTKKAFEDELRQEKLKENIQVLPQSESSSKLQVLDTDANDSTGNFSHNSLTSETRENNHIHLGSSSSKDTLYLSHSSNLTPGDESSSKLLAGFHGSKERNHTLVIQETTNSCSSFETVSKFDEAENGQMSTNVPGIKSQSSHIVVETLKKSWKHEIESSKSKTTKSLNNYNVEVQESTNVCDLSETVDDFQEAPSRSLGPMSVPKSENPKTQCRYEVPKQINKSKMDYSIDGLLKSRETIIKKEPESREMPTQRFDEIFVKQEHTACKKGLPAIVRMLGQKESDKPKANQSSNKPTFISESQTSLENNLVSSANSHNTIKASNTEGKKKKNDACLLHKILRVEDSVKSPSSECLLEKSACNKSSTSTESYRCQEKKQPEQELENTVVYPLSDFTKEWNTSSLYIKKEEEQEKNKRYDCVYEKSYATEKLKKCFIVEDSCNSGSLPIDSTLNDRDYQLEIECGNFTSNYDYESEDSNLVIDEDVDSIKGQNDGDIDESHFCVKNTSAVGSKFDNTNSLDLSNNKTGSSTARGFDLAKMNGLSKNPPVEHKKLCEDLSFKQSLDRTEHVHNTQSPLFTSLLIKESRGSLGEQLKYKCLEGDTQGSSKKGTLHENPTYKQPSSSFTISAKENNYLPSKISSLQDLKTQCIEKTDAQGKASPRQLQGNNSTFSTTPQAERYCLVTDPLTYHTKNDFSDIQSHLGEKSENFVSVKDSTLSTDNSKTSISHNPLHFRSYTQYNTENNEHLFIKENSLSQYKNQVRSDLNDKYQDSITNLESLDKLNLVVSKVQDTQTNFVLNEVTIGDQIGCPSHIVNTPKSNQAFFNETKTDTRQQTQSENISINKNHSASDPLCLVVKNKDEVRDEMYDFELNFFPVAHEVEICSATNSGVGDWICTGSSEIGHPDWPIADEQCVVDSSSSFSYSSQEQYLYSSKRKSDQCCTIDEGDQTVFSNSLELQQVSVHFKYPVSVKSSKEKLNLHMRTLEVDYNLCCSQRKFREFYLSQDIPSTIPVPYPLQGRTDNVKSSVRCTCEQCSDNLQKLLNNYNVLTQFRNSKVKPLNVYSKASDISFGDKDQIYEPDCSLPLKKRKTLTNSKPTEDHKLMSYPNTPMISIAQLDLTNFEQQNQVIVPNPQSHWKDVPDYQAAVHNPGKVSTRSSSHQIAPAVNNQPKTTKRKPCKRRKSLR